jgi:hypothetical protein
VQELKLRRVSDVELFQRKELSKKREGMVEIPLGKDLDSLTTIRSGEETS